MERGRRESRAGVSRKVRGIALGAILMLGAIAGIEAHGAAKKSAPVFPRSNSASIGVVVRDLRTGEDILASNADKMLTPASILKCVTAASVFLDQKEDSCIFTLVSTQGDIDPEGILRGNIVIKGAGDPSLGSKHFPETRAILDSVSARLKAAGVRRIAGSIDIDSLSFREQGPGGKWEVEDLKYSYGAGLYPINWKDNTAGGDRSMREPGEEFVNLLEERLNRDSIMVEWEDYENSRAEKEPLYVHHSPTARDILHNTLVTSHNLFAEGMLRQLSPLGMTKDALAKEARLLKEAGLDTDNLQAYDGSGLTRANSVTPRFMADMLSMMAYQPNGKDYADLFPRVGEEGTVKNLLSNTRLAGRLALKSGSMKGVYCYAGYLLGEGGYPTHAVVIMINGYSCGRAAVKKGIESFLLKELQ